ncbi:MAG TPA: hypothetical protein VK400_06010 [Pyrinomonadaceae bacterium]|nr:hypothetical protein [Pyrinomonadaceae bacterium]
MKKWGKLLLLALCLGLLPSDANSQNDIQCRINILKPGKSNFEELKVIFGNPDLQVKGLSWLIVPGANRLKREYIHNDSKAAEKLLNPTERTLYNFNYPKLGLVFTFFDNPSELHSIEISNPQISIFDIRVGDKLGKINKKLGKGEWYSSDGRDDWSLGYEELGVSFVFLRDLSAPKYPMKLNKKKVVVKIEKYDKETTFTG